MSKFSNHISVDKIQMHLSWISELNEIIIFVQKCGDNISIINMIIDYYHIHYHKSVERIYIHIIISAPTISWLLASSLSLSLSSLSSNLKSFVIKPDRSPSSVCLVEKGINIFNTNLIRIIHQYINRWWLIRMIWLTLMIMTYEKNT